MVHEQDRAGLVGVVRRPEPDHSALGLGEAVHPAARGAVERQLLAVVHEEVLPEVLALLLEEIAQVPDDREVAQDRVLLLGDVLDEDDRDERDEREGDERPQAVRKEAEHAGHRSLLRRMIGENACPGQGRTRRIIGSGSSDAPFSISLAVAGRTSTTVQVILSAIPASGWLASSTTLSSAMSVTVKKRPSSSPPGSPSKRIPTSSASGNLERASTRSRFSS